MNCIWKPILDNGDEPSVLHCALKGFCFPPQQANTGYLLCCVSKGTWLYYLVAGICWGNQRRHHTLSTIFANEKPSSVNTSQLHFIISRSSQSQRVVYVLCVVWEMGKVCNYIAILQFVSATFQQATVMISCTCLPLLIKFQFFLFWFSYCRSFLFCLVCVSSFLLSEKTNFELISTIRLQFYSAVFHYLVVFAGFGSFCSLVHGAFPYKMNHNEINWSDSIILLFFSVKVV